MAVTVPTLLTIRSLVRDYLDEPTPTDWTNTDLNYLINQRYHRIYSAAVEVYQDYNISNTQFNTVAAKQEYGTADGLPTGILKIRRVEINFNATGVAASNLRALPINNIDAVRRDLANNNIGMIIFSQPYYYYLGAKLGFIPIPQNSTANAINFWYIPTLADLVNDSDTIVSIPYPERYWNLIVQGVVADALRFGTVDSKEADKFEQMFIAGITQMQEELQVREADDAKGVLDVTGEYIDFGGLAY